MEKNKPKKINAWCAYDWANSVFSLTITTAIFPGYYLAVTDSTINFLGWEVNNSSLYAFVLSGSFLIAAFLSPFLSSIADYTGRKKMFMQFFCYLGSASCAYLYFFTEDNVVPSVFAFMFACIGYSGSIVFYNAFLPEIATEDKHDKVSAKGFAWGYLGSVILLIFNLSMILFPEVYFDFDAKLKEISAANPGWKNDQMIESAKDYFALKASRISFLSVGVWWFLFAQYTFFHLPSLTVKKETTGNWIFNGFKELGKVISDLSWQRYLKTFLFAFFFYNMGVQTVMYMATLFGKAELQLKTDQLIMVILIIQLIAIPGASIFAWISGKKGNVFSLTIILLIWVGVCIAAYFVREGTEFYSLAIVVGFVMGGVQSMSRSTYSKLIPQDSIDHASYFSFYDIMDKVGTAIGTSLFGIITGWFGGMRNTTFVLAVFFVIGFIILMGIPSLKIYSIKKPE
ncbi:MAG: MFS transporter [Cytophagaceae bacterium]|nr:MFS transporter [Cytophagaceae bacterium]